MRVLRGAVCGAGVWLVVQTACAGGFLQAYAAAQRNDPTYRAARHELAAAAQNVPMARAALEPNVSLSLSNARVAGSRTADNFLGQEVTTPLDYRSPQATLSVRAPLFNREASQRYRQSLVQLEYAQTLFVLRTHELLERLGQAYLQRLFAEQGVQLARTQLASMREQHQQALRRFELGDGTRPEVQQAQADLALAQVQLTDADHQLATARLALAQITGGEPITLQPVTDTRGMPELEPAGPAYWLDQGEATSPAVVARRQALELARIGVARAGAGHYPRVELVGSVSNGRNDSVSTLNQSLSQRSVGVQLNLPLYSGGFVDASVLQALAEQDKAQAELDAELQRVSAELNRAFLTVATGSERLAAQYQALQAYRLLREGAVKGLAGGIGVSTDVVRADVKVAEATRDLARAHHEQVLARLRLYTRAGKEPQEIVEILDGLLSPPVAP
jgi:protease secretion system outer membrane protein